ncbi:hypothetical protein B0J11DRAFT_463794, partial [Dendryphion nanum]
MQSINSPFVFALPASHVPESIPTTVYRVHRPSAQTKYSFASGFRSKNQTTILNQLSMLNNFALAHLHGQTNISSPFISVYDDQAHAERMAIYLSNKFGEEMTVVAVDTRHFARGPVFRAADLLGGKDVEMAATDSEIHRGEYLIMYKIPPQAIRTETAVG